MEKGIDWNPYKQHSYTVLWLSAGAGVPGPLWIPKTFDAQVSHIKWL